MNIMWAMHLQKLLDKENIPISVLALDPGMIVKAERDVYKGKYVKPVGVLGGIYHRDARDEAKAKVLWDASARIAGDILGEDAIVV